LASVNQSTGVVETSFPAIANWSRNGTIESVLVAIKNSMTSQANKRLSQPHEGTTF